MTPWYVSALLALLSALSALNLVVLRWILDEGRKRDAKLDGLVVEVGKINGSVRSNKTWIEGHEKHSVAQDGKILALEDRERRRLEDSWNGPERRSVPRRPTRGE